MDEGGKPPLGADVYEEISLAQYRVHKAYRAKLDPLLVSRVTNFLAAARGEPPLPQQPKHLARLLGEYACALFDAEASHYPVGHELKRWLKNLAERVEESALSRPSRDVFVDLGSFEETLTYHATEQQMREAIREALRLRCAGDESAILAGEKSRLTTSVAQIPGAEVASGAEPKAPIVQRAEENVVSRAQPASTIPSNRNDLAVDIREAAPGVGFPFVDMRKPAGAIARDTRSAALAKGAPYRAVPALDRIMKAVEHKKTTGCTYPAASIKEFGNRNYADKIRYWHDKSARGEQ